jgi:hypothetical protein
MQLDRNENPDGKAKYALINLRKVSGAPKTPQELAAAILANPDCVEFGYIGHCDEFWLMKLRDKHAEPALRAYAESARAEDPEFADQVLELADRAGPNSPFCKSPD